MEQSKSSMIADIIATRDNVLLVDYLWDDPVIVENIRSKLEKVSAANIKHYHIYFCGEDKRE